MPAGASSGELSIDAAQLLTLGRVLKKIDDKTVLKSLRSGLRTAAKPIAARAKANASFSPEVARSITVETAFTAKKSGVFVTAKRSKMPAGKGALPGLFERGQRGNSSSFRHPVFGHDVYVSQPTHPFLAPALEGQQSNVTDAVMTEISKALRAAGLKD